MFASFPSNKSPHTPRLQSDKLNRSYSIGHGTTQFQFIRLFYIHTQTHTDDDNNSSDKNTQSVLTGAIVVNLFLSISYYYVHASARSRHRTTHTLVIFSETQRAHANVRLNSCVKICLPSNLIT